MRKTLALYSHGKNQLIGSKSIFGNCHAVLDRIMVQKQSDHYHSIFLRGNLSRIRFLAMQQLQFRRWTRLRPCISGLLMERRLGILAMINPLSNNLPSVHGVEEFETYLDDLLVSNSVYSSN
ncbi:hypothetical protein Ddye_014927 [Dipteronia dyeriana]|uniref:Uncharacterized protein n=1 Tax=Dipteronia dyeriana TaxID=168575 RepID=A0AAD9U4M5_9ROSI|nr:hypothetical protein Ddye_014927 [Dipteronia dyeriana]